MTDHDLDDVPAELEHEDNSEYRPNRTPLIWLAALLGIAVLTLAIILPIALAVRN